MNEAQSADPAPSSVVPKAETNGQMWTAIFTIAVLGLIALFVLVMLCIVLLMALNQNTKDVIVQVIAFATATIAVISTIVGALSTSLQAPSGIGNVIRAATGGANKEA